VGQLREPRKLREPSHTQHFGQLPHCFVGHGVGVQTSEWREEREDGERGTLTSTKHPRSASEHRAFSLVMSVMQCTCIGLQQNCTTEVWCKPQQFFHFCNTTLAPTPLLTHVDARFARVATQSSRCRRRGWLSRLVLACTLLTNARLDLLTNRVQSFCRECLKYLTTGVNYFQSTARLVVRDCWRFRPPRGPPQPHPQPHPSLTTSVSKSPRVGRRNWATLLTVSSSLSSSFGRYGTGEASDPT
jgi:hypothetical protein